MIYIDRKYLCLISSRLERFKQIKEDLFNFRCNYCGDSQKNSTKARGYIYRKNQDMFYRCHNCNVSTTFAKFLERVDAEQYKNYIMEKYVNNTMANYANTMAVLADADDISPFDMYRDLEEFQTYSIEALPIGHYARDYILNRNIPTKFWNEIYFVDDFKEWMDAKFPHHGKENLPNDPRIVLFYTDREGTITGVTGRAILGDSDLRYIIIKILDTKKVFGIHRMNPAQTVYVIEGQFDSLFLPNAVASGDANLNGLAEYLQRIHFVEDVILVWDNTPRNRDVVGQMDIAIKEGYRVAMLPYDENAKDINEMINGGMHPMVVKVLIDSNTYQGLEAQLQMMQWRKC